MTYEEFKSGVDALIEEDSYKLAQDYRFDEDEYGVVWVSGGMTGGNCWDGAADRRVSPEPMPSSIPILDALLEKSMVCSLFVR